MGNERQGCTSPLEPPGCVMGPLPPPDELDAEHFTAAWDRMAVAAHKSARKQRGGSPECSHPSCERAAFSRGLCLHHQ